ncbi:hypothetical protein Lal_00023786 [Lupinus albus]|nr:hypothetical protein Lal_00023786 [Lupinus albus]
MRKSRENGNDFCNKLLAWQSGIEKENLFWVVIVQVFTVMVHVKGSMQSFYELIQGSFTTIPPTVHSPMHVLKAKNPSA